MPGVSRGRQWPHHDAGRQIAGSLLPGAYSALHGPGSLAISATKEDFILRRK